MRALFSILGLLLVLAVVGVLAKKQMGSVTNVPTLPSNAAGVALPATTPGASPQQQSQQIQQQVQQSVQGAMQAARPVDDEK